MAGLRCAEILIEKGVRVTILEARDRLGGRVSPTPAILAASFRVTEKRANTVCRFVKVTFGVI